MALSKIPDSTLEKLRCTCGQYLSSAPIMISQDGHNVCSKCTNLQPPEIGPSTQNLAYVALAKLFRFPCCYKPKGCTQYVEFDKTTEHEDECLYRVYDCPVNLFSSCEKKVTRTAIYEHYKQNHSELYLQHPTFTVDLTTSFELHRLLKINDVVLLLQTKCSIEAGKLWCNAIYFGNVINASLIQYNIKLRTTDDDKKQVMEFERVRACSINNIRMLPWEYTEVDISSAIGFLNHTILQCDWVINIPEELNDKMKNQHQENLKEIFEINKNKLLCPFCKISMVPPIYRCDENHVSCVDCLGFDNQCNSCLRNGVRFSRADDLEMISKSGNHSCKWRNCNEEFCYRTIRSHEQGCSNREYKCPECQWFGIYDMFINHFRTDHRNIDIHVIDVGVIGLNTERRYYSYMVVQREIVKFSVSPELLYGSGISFGVTLEFLSTPTYILELIIWRKWKCQLKLIDNFGNAYGGRQQENEISFHVQLFEEMRIRNSKRYSLRISTKKKIS